LSAYCITIAGILTSPLDWEASKMSRPTVTLGDPAMTVCGGMDDIDMAILAVEVDVVCAKANAGKHESAIPKTPNVNFRKIFSNNSSIILVRILWRILTARGYPQLAMSYHPRE